MSSKGASPFYISTSTEWEFLLLHVLASVQDFGHSNRCVVLTHCFILFLFILMREREREREREKERRGAEKEKHQFVVSPIYAFIGWFLYVPWPEIKPTTLTYRKDALTNWATHLGLFVVLIYIFLMTFDVEHHMLTCHLCIFFSEVSIKVFSLFF